MPTIDFIAGEEHEVTAVFAHRLWEKRGRPVGSPEVDWFEAKNQLATELAKSEALIALSAVGIEPNEGPWRPGQD